MIEIESGNVKVNIDPKDGDIRVHVAIPEPAKTAPALTLEQDLHSLAARVLAYCGNGA